MNVAIIRTGTANLASVVAAFSRLGCASQIVDNPSEVKPNDAVVLPGVGAFAAGMQSLRQSGWDHFLIQRFAESRPTLAICLGLQLLCESSDESPGVNGLGILPTCVRRLPDHVVVPHFGWNRIESSSKFFESGFVYYANSYCAAGVDALKSAGWDVAVTKHGMEFVGAVRRDAMLACQFHPELSGSLGQRLIAKWLETAGESSDDKTDLSSAEQSSC